MIAACLLENQSNKSASFPFLLCLVWSGFLYLFVACAKSYNNNWRRKSNLSVQKKMFNYW